jgi:hypothetical protein
MNEKDYQPDCWCEDTLSKTICEDCGVSRFHITDKWQFIVNGSKYYYKCRHRDFALQLPDGVTVYASSHTDREEYDDRPDWGLYLDSIWKPRSMSGYIEWVDFGLPSDWKIAAHMIIDAYEKAQAGYWVEVSCIGGHGRTGTVLAAMAVLAGLPSDVAIAYVRENYCNQAIETDQQMWWINWFDCYINSGTTAAYPASFTDDEDSLEAGSVITFGKPFNWRVRNLLGVPGRVPRDEDNDETVYYRYLNQPKPNPVSVLNPINTNVNYLENILEDLTDEVNKILSTKPSDLYSTFAPVVEWIENWERDTRVPTRGF